MENPILSKIDEYNMLLNRKEELTEIEKQNNQAIEACRDSLAQMMIDEDTPKISRNGFCYTLQSKTRYSKRGGADDSLFEMLRDHDLGDLIKETVNAQTLQGAMSNLAEENDGSLPEEWTDVINTFEYNDVLRRKETKRN